MSRKRRTPIRGDIRLPGGRIAEDIYEADPDGRPVVHHRTVDTIGLMRRKDTITVEMEQAARDFLAAFTRAGLDALRVPSLLRVPGNPVPTGMTESQVSARERVHRALAAAGGAQSPAGSALWHVVGLQTSVREWAMREGWGGRVITKDEARGVLVAALGMLAVHFGYVRASRAMLRQPA